MAAIAVGVGQERLPAVDFLFERESEVAEIGAALEAARRGSGRLVIVEGEAGVGKSRLLAVAAQLAAAIGMRITAAAGIQLERDFPFGVALKLFERPLYALEPAARARVLAGPAAVAAPLFEGRVAGGLVDGVDRGYALVHGLRWLATNLADEPAGGAERSLLVLIDDAQWADALSLRFVAHLAASIAELPIAIVIAVRQGAPEDSRELVEGLRSLPGARVLRPAPLGDDAVADLVSATYGEVAPEFVRACARTTGGNPFYLTELLKSARADRMPATAATARDVARLVPESVLRSVLLRMAGLPEAAPALAAAVAVLGDRTPLRQAAALAELEAEVAERAADSLAAVNILRPEDPLSFAHPLIAAAVLGDIPTQAQSRAHRRAADLLAREGGPVEAIAAHLAASRPQGDAHTAKTLREAASRAAGRGDHRAAQHLLKRALEEPPPAEMRDEIRVELAFVQAAAGAPGAVERLTEALELVQDRHSRARALRGLTHLLFARSEPLAAADAAERALRELDEQEPLAAGIAFDQLAIATVDPAVRPKAAPRFAAILEDARHGRLPDDPALLALIANWMATSGESPARVRELALQALADERTEGSFYGLATGFALVALLWVGELELAEHGIELALERALELGSMIRIALASHWRAMLHQQQGDLAATIADAEQTLEMCRVGWDICRPWVAALLAQAHMDRGDLDAAERALRICEAADQDGMHRAFGAEARGQLALRRGDPATALASFQHAGALLAEGFGIDQPTILPWRSSAALAAARLGDGELAADLAETELRQARRAGAPRALGVALRAAGLVTGGERGIELLEESVTVLEASPAKLELARSLVELGAARGRAGQRTAARDPLRRGLELADATGAAPLATRAKVELGTVGGRRRAPRAASGPAALTPTERRVAELAAEGLQTPEIAQVLYTSPKTVEWHLGHVYRKLDIRSRRQLHTALGA